MGSAFEQLGLLEEAVVVCAHAGPYFGTVKERPHTLHDMLERQVDMAKEALCGRFCGLVVRRSSFARRHMRKRQKFSALTTWT